jgi:hypothetical protein
MKYLKIIALVMSMGIISIATQCRVSGADIEARK